MSEHAEDATVSWYDITIAGKQFNIASRRGEAHIRNVERRIEETITDLSDRVQGQNSFNVALLTALNLADQLVTLEAEVDAVPQRFDQQLRTMVSRLTSVMPEDRRAVEIPNKEDTPAVFD